MAKFKFDKSFRELEAGMRKLEESMGSLDKSGFDENGDINLSPDDLLDREMEEMEEEDKSLFDNLRDNINGCVSSVMSSVANEETIQLRDELEQMRDELNRMRFALKHPTNSGSSRAGRRPAPPMLQTPHNYGGGTHPPPEPQMPPNTSHSDFGGTSMQVGRNKDKYKYMLREYEPNTDTTLLIEYDGEFTFRAGINFGNLPSVEDIRRKIRWNINRKNRKTGSSLEEQASDVIRRRGTKKTTSDINQQIVDKLRKNAPSDIADVVVEHCEHEKFMKGTFASIFRERKFFGGKGEFRNFTNNPKVVVSRHNIFGRKYSLKVDDVIVHVPDLEMHMEYCEASDNLDLYVEMRTDDEKAVLTKLINSLIALKIAEPHHLKIKELL